MGKVIKWVAKSLPELRPLLVKAHIGMHPELWIKQGLNRAVTLTLAVLVAVFLLLETFSISLLWLVPIGAGTFFLAAYLAIKLIPLARVNKRSRDLDREVLFAGRFLLVKIHSGLPLLNALIEGSKSYGVAGKYFKEIVDDITLGTPIEVALENSMKLAPSYKYRRILFQINNAIQIGIDISQTLAGVLDEISHEEMVEIQRYGKKLNTLSLFYMLMAIVMPSLGMVMFIVVGTMVGIEFTGTLFLLVWLGLVFIQFAFISVFKNTRLSVNI